MIPDAAVETVARIIAVDNGWVAEAWDATKIPAKYRQRYFDTARAALEAVAPHIAAEAWEQGRDAEFQRSVMKRQTEPNPYRG